MLLVKLYDSVLRWSEHRHAPRYLALLSFAESSFFPIPPDVMLAPMALAKPQRAWRFAFITTLSSVLGGILGYALGYYAFDSIVLPFLTSWGYLGQYYQMLTWFQEWGFWLICLAGSFTPIPFKLFTVGAGALHYNLWLFIIAAIIGRSTRFYLVSGLIQWGGKPMADKLRIIVSKLGWVVVGLCLALLLIKMLIKF